MSHLTKDVRSPAPGSPVPGWSKSARALQKGAAKSKLAMIGKTTLYSPAGLFTDILRQRRRKASSKSKESRDRSEGFSYLEGKYA